MKKLKLFFSVLMLLLMSVGQIWGEKITLTATSLELTGSYTSGTEKTVGGVTFVFTDLMKNSSNIQAKASSGVLYNKTAIPGNITEIKVTHSGTARSTTVCYGTTAQPTTNSETFSGSKTISVSGSNTYFKITRGSNAAYWTSVEITYTPAGSNNPTVLFASFKKTFYHDFSRIIIKTKIKKFMDIINFIILIVGILQLLISLITLIIGFLQLLVAVLALFKK